MKEYFKTFKYFSEQIEDKTQKKTVFAKIK